MKTIRLSDSWKLAERTVFDAICNATDSAEGQQAYLGAVPDGAFNVWSLDSGGGDGRILWNETPTDMRMQAYIDGVFISRDSAQEFALCVIGALPILGVENVQCFRVASDGMPVIKTDFVPVKNDSKAERPLSRLSMKFDFVFRTTQAQED